MTPPRYKLPTDGNLVTLQDRLSKSDLHVPGIGLDCIRVLLVIDTETAPKRSLPHPYALGPLVQRKLAEHAGNGLYAATRDGRDYLDALRDAGFLLVIEHFDTHSEQLGVAWDELPNA